MKREAGISQRGSPCKGAVEEGIALQEVTTIKPKQLKHTEQEGERTTPTGKGVGA